MNNEISKIQVVLFTLEYKQSNNNRFPFPLSYYKLAIVPPSAKRTMF